eukprot:COSAG03_NODE_6019_length_1129_cov_5.102913_1_plen_59_part_10
MCLGCSARGLRGASCMALLPEDGAVRTATASRGNGIGFLQGGPPPPMDFLAPRGTFWAD